MLVQASLSYPSEFLVMNIRIFGDLVKLDLTWETLLLYFSICNLKKIEYSGAVKLHDLISLIIQNPGGVPSRGNYLA